MTTDVVSVSKNTFASINLVTLGEFAQFIRSGAFLNRDHKDETEPLSRHQQLGDGILRRIGLSLRDEEMPVVNITWYEAHAYCRWRASLECKYEGSGRLPYAGETTFLRGRINPIAEWCADWYNRFMTGPNAFPEEPARRRIEGSDAVACASPSLFTSTVGFRIAYDVSTVPTHWRVIPREAFVQEENC